MNARYAAIGIWLLATGCAVCLRPVTPIDETRYLAVAWQMWSSGDLWLPMLNDQIYADKPPLLFWLINLGWWLFGVNDWWPRLLAGLFSLGVIYLTKRCAEQLAQRPEVGDIAALVLIGMPIWALFSGAVMFDMPLAFYCLAAINLLLGIRGAGSVGEWMSIGVCLGFAVLTKGPVAYLHVLPLALLGPVWKTRLEPLRVQSWRRWYRGALIALLLSIGIALIWLVPAVSQGGSAYFQSLLWDQTVHRMTSTTHHLRPFWFYLLVLPILLLPWWLSPTLWRGVRSIWQKHRGLVTVAACWVLPVIIALSLFRGKQVHYVFPLLPIIAILIAKALDTETRQAVYSLQSGSLTRRATAITAIILITAYIVINVRYRDAYDVEPMALSIAKQQHERHTVANIGRYHGQYQFAGRLKEPLVVIRDEPSWQHFIKENPRGYVVAYSRSKPNTAALRFNQRFRSGHASLIAVGDLQELTYEQIAAGDFRALADR